MKTSLAMLLTILIMLGLAGGGYYYLNKQNQSDKKALRTQIDDLTAKLNKEKSATSQIVDTSDWKTYSSANYGFSIKYPNDWTLTTARSEIGTGSSINIVSPETKANYDEAVKSDSSAELPSVDINFNYYPTLADADGSNPKTWKTFSDMYNDKGYFSQSAKITFAGQEAYEAIEGGMASYYVILAQNNNHIYKILFNSKPAKQDLTGTDNAILSSFQFTR